MFFLPNQLSCQASDVPSLASNANYTAVLPWLVFILVVVVEVVVDEVEAAVVVDVVVDEAVVEAVDAVATVVVVAGGTLTVE